MQGTPENDDFTLYPYMDPYPATLDGGAGEDLLRLSIADAMTLTLDFSTPAIPRTIHWADGAQTVIVNIEWIQLDAWYGTQSIHVVGGHNDDTLAGTAHPDYLDGSGGNDILDAGAPGVWNGGPDTVLGGAGNDSLFNLGMDRAQSFYSGGEGRDLFVLGSYDLFYEGRITYNDTITDFAPGAGGDVLQWSEAYASDYWLGKLRMVQAGADVVIQELLEAPATDRHVVSYDYAWTTLVTLQNVALSDFAKANFTQAVELTDARDDVLRGTDAPDLLNGGFGDDDLLGRAGHDTLNGAQGRDTLNGGDGDDTITGGYGDDLIFGGTGDDRIAAGFENDKVFGDAGDDRVIGEQGDDTLSGGAGHDRLDGGRGQDRLYGNGGDDTLVSGAGHDVMRGDEGRDVFVISQALYGQWDRNTVLDFHTGEDRLDLRSLGLLSFDQIAPLIEEDADGHATLLIWDEADYFGPAERVTLLGVAASELSARDFVLGG